MNRVIFCAIIMLLALTGKAQNIRPVTADQLMKRVSNSDTTYIVNFWATWCGPCVKELPIFDTLQTKYKGQKVKVLLVSFDFASDYKKKLAAYISKKHPQPEIVWFSETDANEFIPKIDNRWSGALPATLIIKGSEREFYEAVVSLEKVSAATDKMMTH